MTNPIAICLTMLLSIAVTQTIHAQKKEVEEEKVIELKKDGDRVIVIQTDGKKGKYRILTDETELKDGKKFGFRIVQDDEDIEGKSGNKKIQKKRIIKRKSSGDSDATDDKLPAEVRAALKKHGIDVADGNVEVDVEKSDDGTHKYKIQSSSKDGDAETKKVVEIQIRHSDDDSDSKPKKRVKAKDGVYRLQLKKIDFDEDGTKDLMYRVKPKIQRNQPDQIVRQIKMVGSPKDLQEKVDQLDRRMKNIERKLDRLLKKMDK